MELCGVVGTSQFAVVAVGRGDIAGTWSMTSPNARPSRRHSLHVVACCCGDVGSGGDGRLPGDLFELFPLVGSALPGGVDATLESETVRRRAL